MIDFDDENDYQFLPSSSNTPNYLRNMFFYAARDGMGKILCNFLLRHSLGELSSLVEQQVKDSYGQILTPLIVAAKNGHNIVVRLLINRFEVQLEHEGCVLMKEILVSGVTPLWCAAGSGHLNVVKTLVNAGGDVNHCTTSGSSPIRAACIYGRLDIVKYLVMHGADPHKTDIFNNTCLMVASYKGHLEIVKYLLEMNVDPNVQAICGETALYLACEGGFLDIVKELLENGALHVKANSDLYPIQAAAKRTRDHVVEYLMEVCDLPIEDRINAYELLGASFANDRENQDLVKTYQYLEKGMLLRCSSTPPVFKILGKPIPAYDNWIERQTFQELQAIKNNENALHMESLSIRERLLGKYHPDVPQHIIFRGAVFADNLMFDRCIKLWTHALTLAQNMEGSISHDLRRFAQIFAQMLHDNLELPFQDILRILKMTVVELEKATELCDSKILRRDHLLYIQEECDTNTLTALYLIKMMAYLLKDGDPHEVYEMHRAIFRLNQLQVAYRGSVTLLHLAVTGSTPAETNHMQTICRFPCSTTASILIKCGANVNALDDDRNTPMHYIVKHLDVRDFSEVNDIIKLLVAAGAHLDVMNRKGQTTCTAPNNNHAASLVRQQWKKVFSLKCLAARVVGKCCFEKDIPEHLFPFVRLHTNYIKGSEDDDYVPSW